jgi:hypothetical protein
VEVWLRWSNVRPWVQTPVLQKEEGRKKKEEEEEGEEVPKSQEGDGETIGAGPS